MTADRTAKRPDTIVALGATRIAEELGVERPTFYRWIADHGPGRPTQIPMPEPAAVVHTSSKDKREHYVYGWSVDQLPALRRWAEQMEAQKHKPGKKW